MDPSLSRWRSFCSAGLPCVPKTALPTTPGQERSTGEPPNTWPGDGLPHDCCRNHSAREESTRSREPSPLQREGGQTSALTRKGSVGAVLTEDDPLDNASQLAQRTKLWRAITRQFFDSLLSVPRSWVGAFGRYGRGSWRPGDNANTPGPSAVR